jgi:hypothetical protein
MFYELFLFGTFWFWILVAVEIGFLIYCAARECAAWQTLVSVLVFLGVLQCLSNVNVVMYLIQHPITLAIVIAIYLLGGSVWVFPKWWLFCHEHLRKYLELREKFQRDNKLAIGEAVPIEYRDNWSEFYTRNNSYHEDHIVFKPEPGNYKNRIITWMTLWPISFLWTMLNDPIVRFFRHIYYEIAGVLRRISENVFKDVSQDFEKEAK